MRISDWSSDVCSSDLAQKIVKLLFRPSGQSEAGKIGRVSPPVCREHTCRGPMLRTMQRHEGPNPIERQWSNRWVQGLRVKPRRLFEKPADGGFSLSSIDPMALDKQAARHGGEAGIRREKSSGMPEY